VCFYDANGILNRFYIRKSCFSFISAKNFSLARKKFCSLILDSQSLGTWLGGEKIPKKRDTTHPADGQHKHTHALREKKKQKKPKKKDNNNNNNNNGRHLLRCNLERDDDTIIIAVDDNGARSALSADELDEE
jgi:hypothetical protein